MKCDKLHRDLIFYLEGGLDRERRNEISSHLHGCESCRNFADYLELSLSIIDKEKEPEVNPFLYTRIKQKIDNPRYRRSIFITSAAKFLRPSVISIILIFGVFAGIKIGSYLNNKFLNNATEIQVETYYLNDFQHEPVETNLLAEEFETENIN